MQFVVSNHILLELDRALRKPYFVARLDDSERQLFLFSLLEFATIVEIAEPIPTVLPDYADNLVLATALSGRAPFLVSGDRELQRLGEYQGVKIVTARAFLEELPMRADPE